MKTAMQQLIEYLDPIHSAIKDKAIELLKVENEQMERTFKEGKNVAIRHFREEIRNNYYIISKKDLNEEMQNL